MKREKHSHFFFLPLSNKKKQPNIFFSFSFALSLYLWCFFFCAFFPYCLQKKMIFFQKKKDKPHQTKKTTENHSKKEKSYFTANNKTYFIIIFIFYFFLRDAPADSENNTFAALFSFQKQKKINKSISLQINQGQIKMSTLYEKKYYVCFFLWFLLLFSYVLVSFGYYTPPLHCLTPFSFLLLFSVTFFLFICFLFFESFCGSSATTKPRRRQTFLRDHHPFPQQTKKELHREDSSDFSLFFYFCL